MRELAQPSALILEQWQALRAAARLGPIVELACGRGRIACAVAGRGLPIVGIDRSPEFLAELRERAARDALPVTAARCDLESGRGLPLAPESCGAILVFRYLHRPLAVEIENALVPGGLLLYETFTCHQRDLGYGPSRDAFLLEDGELPTLFPGLEPIARWEGVHAGERPEAMARLAARRADP